MPTQDDVLIRAMIAARDGILEALKQKQDYLAKQWSLAKLIGNCDEEKRIKRAMLEIQKEIRRLEKQK